MAAFLSLSYSLAFLLLNIWLEAIDAGQNLAFSFENFDKGSNFESRLALFGDAKAGIGNMSVVELASLSPFSGGGLVCKEPINLASSVMAMVSFSTYLVFSFSMSGQNRNGLAFFMIPSNLPHNSSDLMGILGVTSSKSLAINGIQVGIDIVSSISVKFSNLASLKLVLNSGEKEKLQAWIDYEAIGKRIEVRLSESSGAKPVSPLLSHPIDLSNMWKVDNVTVGLSSVCGNGIIIHSWSFDSRTTPHRIHSEPLDPEDLSDQGERLNISKRTDECAVRVFVALVLGYGCGAIGAFLVLLYLWTVFGGGRPVIPEECGVGTNKFDACLDKAIEYGNK